MKNLEDKAKLIHSLMHNGLNFEKDPFQLSSNERSNLANLAKEYNYKKPVNGYFSLGSSFFVHLQKIYNKIKKVEYLYSVNSNGRVSRVWCNSEKEVTEKFFSYLKRKKIDKSQIREDNFKYYIESTNISFHLVKYIDICETTFFYKIEVTY